MRCKNFFLHFLRLDLKFGYNLGLTFFQKIPKLFAAGSWSAQHPRSIKALRKGHAPMSFNVSLDREKCNGCEECLEACTGGVFEMRNGKSVPVSAGDCIGCQSCVEICEQQAITVEEVGIQMSDTCQALLRDIL